MSDQPASAIERDEAVADEPSADEAPAVAAPVDAAPEPPDESASATVEDATEAAADTDEGVNDVLMDEAKEEVEEVAEAAPVYASGAIEETPEEAPAPMDWYILKVQSNREASISDALKRRIKVEGLDDYFDQVIVPTEMVTEFKGGKKKVVKRKLYPGYIVVHMAINDDTWFVVRETPGIGDFTGAGGKPTPMLPHEVERIIPKGPDEKTEEPKLQFKFDVGDRVKINEGTFENFEGEVSSLDEASGRATVMINIFGRSTPVELEYWQVETL